MKQALVNREWSFFAMTNAALCTANLGLGLDCSVMINLLRNEDRVTELQRRLWAFEPQIANSAERNRRSEGIFPHSLGRIR
jgi:hypothetical protein